MLFLFLLGNAIPCDVIPWDCHLGGGLFYIANDGQYVFKNWRKRCISADKHCKEMRNMELKGDKLTDEV